jgi:hypothetical protein
LKLPKSQRKSPFHRRAEGQLRQQEQGRERRRGQETVREKEEGVWRKQLGAMTCGGWVDLEVGRR